VYIIPLVVLMFAIGLYPKPYLDVITPAADRVVRGINNYLPEQLRADRSGEKAAAILAELGVAAKPEGGER
jgi:hypothetical protein